MHKKRVSGINVLLKKNLSKGQLAGFSIANTIGLTVILCGVLFFCDSRPDKNEKDNFFSDDYIVISKKVTGINLEPVAFDNDEIEEIKGQTWVKKTGKFTPARFSVSASMDMGGRGMSSSLFLESVPDDFFDKLPDKWEFEPNNNYVPIMLNKDYLSLYNFGFAIPQGLPQLSEDIIGSIPLKLMLSGKNGERLAFNAYVVGFSSRLNTIAVPQDFMDWANNILSSHEIQAPSRLILKVDRMKASVMEKFMEDKGYEIAGDKSGSNKMSEFFSILSLIIGGAGLIVSLLAFFILILSIFLLLQKSREIISHILLLGYSPNETSRYYRELIIVLNFIIMGVSVGLTFVCRLIWLKPMESLGLGHGNVLPVIGAGLIYYILTVAINIIIIKKHILDIWYDRK